MWSGYRDDRPVLVLEGVSLDKLFSTSTLWDQQPTSNKKKKKEVDQKLPEEFFDILSWPQSTKHKCCGCHLKYNTVPVPMPTKTITRPDGSMGFKVEYHYCSFPCCIFAIMEITDTAMRQYRLAMLKLLFRLFFGIDMQDCDPSPSYKSREDYGGELSKQEFRKRINKLTIKAVGATVKKDKRFILRQS
jgi:hypothetical protein